MVADFGLDFIDIDPYGGNVLKVFGDNGFRHVDQVRIGRVQHPGYADMEGIRRILYMAPILQSGCLGLDFIFTDIAFSCDARRVSIERRLAVLLDAFIADME